MRNFTPFVQLCTRPLNGDPALRREVEQELEAHLEDAFDDEQSQGRPEAEAEENARRRFGDPETLAQSLLEANHRRLKLRARLRLLIKIALVPAILAGLFLCIDLRTLSGLVLMNEFGTAPFFEPPGSRNNSWVRAITDYRVRNFEPAEQEWFRSYFQIWNAKSDWDWSRKCYEAHPEDRIFTANYARNLFPMNEYTLPDGTFSRHPLSEQEREKRKKIIDHGRKIDPDNALYDYLEADLIAASALVWKNEKKPNKKTVQTLVRVTDRAAFDRGMELYLAGLQKPYLKTYCSDLTVEALRRLKPENDYLGLQETLIARANTKLDFLLMARKLTQWSIAYGELLEKEGKPEEAEKYFRSWRQFLPQQQEFDADTLIEALVYYACIGNYLDSAQKRGDLAEAEKLEKINTAIAGWRLRTGSGPGSLLKHAGILAERLLPGMEEGISLEELAPERKLSYRVYDLIGLALLSLLLTGIILVLAVVVAVKRLTGRRPFLLLLPGASYRRLLLWGVIFPIALFLIYTNIDLLSGRDLSLTANLARLILGMIGIIFLFPLFFELLLSRELKKQGKALGFPKGKLPYATLCLNRLCAFALLLLLTGGILRPLLDWECRRLIAEDSLFNTPHGFSKVENQVAAKLSGKLKQSIAEADRE